MARSLKDIMGSMQSMSELTIPKDLFAMLYSEFGMGKTTTAMGLAQAIRGDGQILFLDSSDGWVSLEEYPALLDGATRIQIKDPRDIMVIANGLATGAMKGFNTVVIDELSTIFDIMLEQYLREKYSLGPDEQLVEAEGRDYGPPTAAMASFLRKLQEVDGLNLIVTAHAREVQAEGAIKEIRAAFPPKAFAEVMRKTHVTAALSARRRKVAGSKEIGYERTLQLKPSASVSAKSRIRNSPVTTTPEEFIELVANWLSSDDFTADMQTVTETEAVPDPVHLPEPVEGDDESIIASAMGSISDIVDQSILEDAAANGKLSDEEEDEEGVEEAQLDIVAQLALAEGTTLKQRDKQLRSCSVAELREYVTALWEIDASKMKKVEIVEGILGVEFPSDEEPEAPEAPAEEEEDLGDLDDYFAALLEANPAVVRQTALEQGLNEKTCEKSSVWNLIKWIMASNFKDWEAPDTDPTQAEEPEEAPAAEAGDERVERKAELEDMNIFQLRKLVNTMFPDVNAGTLSKEEIIDGVLHTEFEG